MVSKYSIISLTLIFSLIVFPLIAPSKGTENPSITECAPLLATWSDAESTSQPYIGYYMTLGYLFDNPIDGGATGVRATVSFKGTDKSVIQNDNWLMAGIAAQGPDGVYGGINAIDWGYIFSLMIDPHLSQPCIYAEVFQGNEWINGLPGYATSIDSWYSIIPGLTIDSSVTLTMNWTQDALNYYAEVDGTTSFMHSFIPSATANHYFKTGTTARSWLGIPLANTVKFMQFFGAWSKYNIGRLGWHTNVSFPSYVKGGEDFWRNVIFAYSTDGPNSYWDNTLGWGGIRYENVTASYGRFYAHFYPTINGITLPPDTTLWAPAPYPFHGCPYIYSWNGSQYTIDNNILPASERNNGTDVNDYYKLEQTPVPKYEGEHLSIHSFSIKEFENEHSYIDHVKLLAVDHTSDINVAATSDGRILTYRNPRPPESAINSHGESVLLPISYVDGDYYEGFNEDCLTLNFGRIYSQTAKLVMRTDPPYKVSIHAQVSDSNGNWTDIATIIPRIYWATDIVDLSSYLPNPDTEFRIRLYFTATHKIDFVGLDTSSQENYTMISATPILATHSTQGNVLLKLILNDQIYAELLPGQEIKLTFMLPGCKNQKRTFIFYTEGHYFTIP